MELNALVYAGRPQYLGHWFNSAASNYVQDQLNIVANGGAVKRTFVTDKNALPDSSANNNP